MNDNHTIPIFILSLDVEMLWGPANSNDIALLEGKMHRNREAVQTIIQILDDYHFPATWAVVGHLFEESCTSEACLTSLNKARYHYKPDWYYDPYTDISTDPFYYGPDIIRMIQMSDTRHDIGYHSYSHPVFSDICRDMAEDELRAAERIRERWDLAMDSFVFPQDKVAHVDLLAKHGFTIFRGPPQRPKLKFIAPAVMPIKRGDVWEIPSSVYFLNLNWPRMLNIGTRIGLRKAMEKKEVFHMYLHPWSILLREDLATELRNVITDVASMRDEGAIDILTMHDYAKRLNDLKD